MPEQGVRNTDRRQLAAVMLTDIVAYTALCQADEERTLRLLQDHTEAVRTVSEEHDGHVIKSTGDGFLVVFPSALQATRCAVALQKVVTGHQQQLRIRVGIHLGDILYRGGDVFGDGVNVVSRIEPLADPDGICISRQVHDQVWNKMDVEFESLGPRLLRNVERPLEVYRVNYLQGPRHDDPTMSANTRIAVLPLVNISNDSADGYFADGLTEELIFTLSKLEGLRVIAQTSAMKYRGTKKSVSEIGQELKVGTVLEGSVRKAGSRLRITLQLIDASSEEHLWSEAYDRDLGDVFALQSDIAQSVGAALQGCLIPCAEDGTEITTVDPQAYMQYLKGRALLNRRTATTLHEAIECFEHALRQDDTYAPAYASMAEAYSVFDNYDTTRVPRETSARAKKLAMKAVRLDGELPHAHAVLGIALEHEFAFDEAERELRLAISLDPSCVRAHHWLGYVLCYQMRFAEAISEVKRAVSLDPLSATLHGALGHILYTAGQDEQALRELTTSVELFPEHYMAYGLRGQAHLLMGRYEEALLDLAAAGDLFGAPHEGILLDTCIASAHLGDDQALRRGLDELLALGQAQPASAYICGRFNLLLDQPEEGFTLLEKALDERDTWACNLKNHFELFHRQYRDDPRYLALLKKLGF